MNNNKKIIWVDTLKSIGILAVILGHIASPLSGFIFSWHMPLFFIIAGFFIRIDVSLKEFIVKDFHRLMIPYFIFAFIGLGADFFKRALLHREHLNYWIEFQDIIFQMDMNGLKDHYGFVLWFLPALFFAKLILIALHKINNNTFFNIGSILILFGISFFIELPFALDNAFNSVLWIFIGFQFYQFYQESKFLYILPFIGLGLIIFIGIPSLDMAIKHYSDPFINILWVISIIYTIIVILKKITYVEKIAVIVQFLGQNTMLLFIAHVYTNNIAHIVLEKLGYSYWWLEFMMTFSMLLVILFLKEKYHSKRIFKYV